ncbi:MAG: NAD(P)/FAD-dependent oxidoreductase [Candidatus Omnitrophota bacterium]|jgi:phytoene dehydrogenase-like protein
MQANKGYDVAIIGAGVGGLICGCYLAKAGLKTVIIEKNIKVGGYCTTFSNKEFHFDAYAHSLGGCENGGNLERILKELNIEKELILLKASPARVIVDGNNIFKIFSNAEVTLHALSSYFPHERNGLKKVFEIVQKLDYFRLTTRLQGSTFDIFLKTYIRDSRLYNLFSFLLFQSSGLPASLMSSLLGVIVLRDYILAGGYYPMGGMQQFPEILKSLFVKFGGTILLNAEAKHIALDKIPTTKINVGTTTFREIKSSIVISNADPIHTLTNIIGINANDKRLKTLLGMKPALSCFTLYLKLRKYPMDNHYVQFVSLDRDIEKYIYKPISGNNFSNIYLDCFFNKFDNSGCATLSLLVPFNSKKFWCKNKNSLEKKIITEFITQTGLMSSDVELIGVTTPINLFNWTYSYRGASFGWEPSVSQVFPNFLFPFNIPNLYFVGQWIGMGHGISTVAYLGRYLAKVILDRKEGQGVCPWVSMDN